MSRQGNISKSFNHCHISCKMLYNKILLDYCEKNVLEYFRRGDCLCTNNFFCPQYFYTGKMFGVLFCSFLPALNLKMLSLSWHETEKVDREDRNTMDLAGQTVRNSPSCLKWANLAFFFFLTLPSWWASKRRKLTLSLTCWKSASVVRSVCTAPHNKPSRP